VIAALALLVTLAVAWWAHRDHDADRDHAATLARETHEHERLLAREARLQERRAETYRAMLEMAFRVQDVVNDTLPILQWVPGPPPVEPPTIDEQRAMAARISAFGSAEVVAGFAKVTAATRVFFDAARDWQMMQPGPEVMPRGSAEEFLEARHAIDRRRADVRTAVDELERLARSELAS
jgi:hypothetical protein